MEGGLDLSITPTRVGKGKALRQGRGSRQQIWGRGPPKRRAAAPDKPLRLLVIGAPGWGIGKRFCSSTSSFPLMLPTVIATPGNRMVASCAGGEGGEMERDTALFLLSISLSFSPMVETCLLYSIEVFPSPHSGKIISLLFLSRIFFLFPFISSFLTSSFFLVPCCRFCCYAFLFFFPYVYVCVCSLALFVCSNAREEYFWVVVFFSCVPAHVLFPQASQFLSLFCHIRRFPECVFELFSFPFSLLHLCLPIGIPDSVVSIT